MIARVAFSTVYVGVVAQFFPALGNCCPPICPPTCPPKKGGVSDGDHMCEGFGYSQRHGGIIVNRNFNKVTRVQAQISELTVVLPDYASRGLIWLSWAICNSDG
jgi:hypothetical protein